MGLYDRLENERIGEETRRRQSAESRGSEIAREQINRAAEIEAQQLAQSERESDAYSKGQESERLQMLNNMVDAGYLQDDMNATAPQEGLGMGSQTLDGIQQQDDMQQSSLENEAISIIQQLGEAQAQGATPEQLEQMFQSIPPELKGKVMEIKQMTDAQQQQSAQTPQGNQRDPYGITAGSAQLLQEVMQPQQQPQQQQMQ